MYIARTYVNVFCITDWTIIIRRTISNSKIITDELYYISAMSLREKSPCRVCCIGYESFKVETSPSQKSHKDTVYNMFSLLCTLCLCTIDVQKTVAFFFNCLNCTEGAMNIWYLMSKKFGLIFKVWPLYKKDKPPWTNSNQKYSH